MDEASDVLSNKRDRLNKRRKLNIDNAIGEDVGLALNTPRSQRVESWIGGTQTPNVIDLTGDDTPIATPVPETLESDEVSEDEVAANIVYAAVQDESSREATFVQTTNGYFAVDS